MLLQEAGPEGEVARDDAAKLPEDAQMTEVQSDKDKEKEEQGGGGFVAPAVVFITLLGVSSLPSLPFPVHVNVDPSPEACVWLGPDPKHESTASTGSRL